MPTVSWATLDPTPAPELRYYADDAMPDAMPPGAEEFTLRPGAVLYVPQGYWHETESDEESVSLHVHLKPLVWADALLNTLRARLLSETAFRQPTNSLWDPQARDEVAERAETLLRELADVVGRLRATTSCPRSPRGPPRCGKATASRGGPWPASRSHLRPAAGRRYGSPSRLESTAASATRPSKCRPLTSTLAGSSSGARARLRGRRPSSRTRRRASRSTRRSGSRGSCSTPAFCEARTPTSR